MSCWYSTSSSMVIWSLSLLRSSSSTLRAKANITSPSLFNVVSCQQDISSRLFMPYMLPRLTLKVGLAMWTTWGYGCCARSHISGCGWDQAFFSYYMPTLPNSSPSLRTKCCCKRTIMFGMTRILMISWGTLSKNITCLPTCYRSWQWRFAQALLITKGSACLINQRAWRQQDCRTLWISAMQSPLFLGQSA